jgi:Retrotransposon gag protein
MYKELNADHEIMQSPYLCTMLALTFIKGPLVEDWATDQVKTLEEKVTRQVNPLLQTDSTLWTDFVTTFDANFSNIAQKQHAMSALYHLHMQKDCFNDYVAAFKHFTKQAEFDLTHPATIQLFIMGIKNNLQNAILH